MLEEVEEMASGARRRGAAEAREQTFETNINELKQRISDFDNMYGNNNEGNIRKEFRTILSNYRNLKDDFSEKFRSDIQQSFSEIQNSLRMAALNMFNKKSNRGTPLLTTDMIQSLKAYDLFDKNFKFTDLGDGSPVAQISKPSAIDVSLASESDDEVMIVDQSVQSSKPSRAAGSSLTGPNPKKSRNSKDEIANSSNLGMNTPSSSSSGGLIPMSSSNMASASSGSSSSSNVERKDECAVDIERMANGIYEKTKVILESVKGSQDVKHISSSCFPEYSYVGISFKRGNCYNFQLWFCLDDAHRVPNFVRSLLYWIASKNEDYVQAIIQSYFESSSQTVFWNAVRDIGNRFSQPSATGSTSSIPTYSKKPKSVVPHEEESTSSTRKLDSLLEDLTTTLRSL